MQSMSRLGPAEKAVTDADQRENFNQRRKAVRESREVQNYLPSLRRKGVDTDQVLELLMLSAHGKPIEVRRQLNRQRRRLKSLSDHLDVVALEVKSTLSCPETFPDAWLDFFSPHDREGSERLIGALNERVTKALQIAQEMQELSTTARSEEKGLSSVLKYLQRSGGPDACIAALFDHIHAKTGNFHDDVVAELLNAAHCALGSPRRFTVEQLYKFRQRHVGQNVGLLVKKRPGALH